MKDVRGVLNFIGVVVGITFALAGCLPDGDKVIEGNTQVDIVPAIPPNETGSVDPDKVVCDPFNDGGEPPLERTQGVKARLGYLEPDKPHCDSMASCLAAVTAIDVDLYFSAIDFPTRPFDKGFVTQSGSTLLTPQGDTLYEYFTISFDGRIRLATGQPAGWYQFATLADDGAMLRMPMGSGTEMATLVDNDGTHETRFECASQPVYIGDGEAVPFELDYYQGPRFHIAMMVMWRPWPGDANWRDPSCGKQGNDMFFDSTKTPPKPQSAYLKLLQRGWSPVMAENYMLPQAPPEEEPEENPCNAPAPVISNFRIVEVGVNEVTVAWSTDIPSTSQAVALNQALQTQTLSAVESSLNTQHTVTITGLMSNTVYMVNGRSASSSGRSTDSSPLSVRTRRDPGSAN